MALLVLLSAVDVPSEYHVEQVTGDTVCAIEISDVEPYPMVLLTIAEVGEAPGSDVGVNVNEAGATDWDDRVEVTLVWPPKHIIEQVMGAARASSESLLMDAAPSAAEKESTAAAAWMDMALSEVTLIV